MAARLNYVELPATNLAASRAFYESAFGWAMTAYGPTYAATGGEGTNIGLQADPTEARPAPLPVITVDDLEAAVERVLAAGGSLVVPIFAFPGGRRFHVRDPGGNEIAVSASDPD
jgi:predicted enzyme related to lactoylglutathione lyase